MKTKKDFIFVANLLKEANQATAEGKPASEIVKYLENCFVIRFRADNPLFNEAKFREACK